MDSKREAAEADDAPKTQFYADNDETEEQGNGLQAARDVTADLGSIRATTPAKKRGRPPKVAKLQDEEVHGNDGEASDEAQADDLSPPKKKARGRPRKSNTAQDENIKDDDSQDIDDQGNDFQAVNNNSLTSSGKKGRGRPRKSNDIQDDDIEDSDFQDKGAQAAKGTITPKKRGPGRPPKSKNDEIQADSAKKIGPSRPPKSNHDEIQASDDDVQAESAKKRGPGRPPRQQTDPSDASRAVATPRTTRSAGKAVSTGPALKKTPRKSKPTPSSPKRLSNVSIKVPIVEKDDGPDEDSDGPSYWLMKAEPEPRIEKGIDVKFSIDDLKDATAPEPWDGVRNATARNNMRLMMKGDSAFFYHSNCKIPGIVGIMEIVQEHSVDESAFEPNHPYYDPKSTREAPKWCVVHVEFRRKFSKMIKLKELQKYGEDGGVLEKMQVLKQSRLSVSKVSKREWDFIMSLVDTEDVATDSPSST